jgi:hypothetical protein
MKTVLDLRSAHGKAGAPLTDIDKYLDLSFYQAATYQAATN